MGLNDEYRKTLIINGDEEPQAGEMDQLWAYEVAKNSKAKGPGIAWTKEQKREFKRAERKYGIWATFWYIVGCGLIPFFMALIIYTITKWTFLAGVAWIFLIWFNNKNFDWPFELAEKRKNKK